LFTMASAAALTCSAETAWAKQFQLFQPIGGVSAILSPTIILNFRFVFPSAFFARNVTVYSPFLSRRPEMRPDSASTRSPLGKSSTAKLIGRSPVAGIVNRNGEPGRTPKTSAPLILGERGAAGVRIIADSGGALMVTSFASSVVSNFASAQSA